MCVANDSVRAGNFVVAEETRTQIDGVWEQGSEKNI